MVSVTKIVYFMKKPLPVVCFTYNVQIEKLHGKPSIHPTPFLPYPGFSTGVDDMVGPFQNFIGVGG